MKHAGNSTRRPVFAEGAQRYVGTGLSSNIMADMRFFRIGDEVGKLGKGIRVNALVCHRGNATECGGEGKLGWQLSDGSEELDNALRDLPQRPVNAPCIWVIKVRSERKKQRRT